MFITQSVNEADPDHVQGEEGVVHVFASHVVHEQVVDHRSQGGAQTGQVVDHADPDAVHLHPGDAKRHQHQEKKQGDA